MTYALSITSLGQVSIPAHVRRLCGFTTSSKVLLTVEDGRVTLAPVRDALALRGSVKTQNVASSKEIRSSFEDFLAQEGRR